MAYADWDINKLGGSNFHGGNQGTARRHIYLENPLTGYGDYCRQYILTSGSASTLLYYTLKETLEDGLFFEIPSSKTISMRASLRYSNFAGNNTAIGITAKFDPSFISLSTTSPKGYTVMLGDTTETSTGGNIKIVCDNKSGAHSTTVTSISVAADEWERIRMDVTSVSATEDLIEIYTGTGDSGEEVWTLIESKTVLDSDSFWIPWAESGSGKVGFFVLSSNSTRSVFIDNFEIYVGDV